MHAGFDPLRPVTFPWSVTFGVSPGFIQQPCIRHARRPASSQIGAVPPGMADTLLNVRRCYTVKLALAYIALLCLIQFPVFSSDNEFMLAYNHIVWAAVCATAFASYPWLQSRLFGSASVRFGFIFTRAAAIFAIVVGVILVAFIIPSDHYGEWPLGLFFIAVPSAIASIAALSISYGIFRLNRRLIVRSMKLIEASRDSRLTGLSFDRPEGRLDIRCLGCHGQIPSCDVWIGHDTPIAPDSEEEAEIEKLLTEWAAAHIPARLIKAFETPGMHIRLTDEGTQQYHVWSVLDHLRNRQRARPER